MGTTEQPIPNRVDNLDIQEIHDIVEQFPDGYTGADEDSARDTPQERTTLSVSKAARTALNAMKKQNETQDDALRRLLYYCGIDVQQIWEYNMTDLTNTPTLTLEQQSNDGDGTVPNIDSAGAD